MNKFDIIKILAKKKDLSTQDADQIISIITEEISNSLYYGDRVEFRGFGVFYTNTRKKRPARNPKTGEEIIGIFKELSNSGITVIIITHDNSVAKKTSRIIEMKDGMVQ